ncbi:TIGR04282 family arsenosugar biosynthesis glycosyltransferase [Ketobacter alkanivorans]|nr:TIGR04282 family arsenosugar biosynthesis glycosyltransferase [Ketobacter alkanivorans]
MTKLIQVFAKAPVKGQVKTRIAKAAGGDFALHIHHKLCAAVIGTALASDADEVEVWTTNVAAQQYFEEFGTRCLQQQGTHLGTRMDFALRHGLARYDQVIIVGADALSITPDYLAEAFRALDQSSVVVGPALDGGYIMIGATEPVSFVFGNMPWGTADVMGLTLERLLTNGVNFHVMGDRWDIDTLQDIEQHVPQWLKTES